METITILFSSSAGLLSGCTKPPPQRNRLKAYYSLIKQANPAKPSAQEKNNKQDETIRHFCRRSVAVNRIRK
jgi:hypothetical protein